MTTYKNIPNLATAFEEGLQTKAMGTLWLGNNITVCNTRESCPAEKENAGLAEAIFDQKDEALMENKKGMQQLDSKG